MRVCTAVTLSRLALARVLADRLADEAPEATLVVAVLDDTQEHVQSDSEPFARVPDAELGLPDLAVQADPWRPGSLAALIRPRLVEQGGVFVTPEALEPRAVPIHGGDLTVDLGDRGALIRRGHLELRDLPYGRSPLARHDAQGVVMRRLWRKAGTHGIVDWDGPVDAALAAFLTWLRQPAAEFGVDGIPRALAAVWETRTDLQEAFPDPGDADLHGLLAWGWTTRDTTDGLPGEVLRAPPPAPAARPSARAAPPRDAREQGVNVIGFLRSELGLGEASRLAIRALDAVRVPVMPIDSPLLALSRREAPFASPPGTDAPFDVNLVGVNVDAVLPLADTLGRGFFRDRYSIGHWFWEVDEFPVAWQPAFDLVDEVWAASRFAADMLRRVSPVPVHRVPLPVRLPLAGPFARGKYAIPPDDFLFLFLFDHASVSRRKNPEGVIEAFVAAFAEDDAASLLIKSINGEWSRGDARELQVLAGCHPKVRVVDEYVSPRERDALLAGCDCYVSLHRCEGFGLTVAEAMALGRPVIATSYGGVTDFLDDATGYPVDFRLERVGEDARPYPPEARWARPSVAHATARMREVFEDRDTARARGAAGARRLAAMHAPAVVGRHMMRRLDAIAGEAHERARARVEGPPAEQPRSGAAEPLRAATAALRDRTARGAAANGPSPHGRAGEQARRALLRVLRPHTMHQTAVDETLAVALDRAAEQVEALEAELAVLRRAAAGRMDRDLARATAELLAEARRQADRIDATTGELDRLDRRAGR